ncbi:MAG: hypothetical protein JWO55_172 [Candidatus Saccharibacteria bacterium]|jgi:hypothetical protein|nr:hypothetical protein [Candidatus Saccharibacteria bacterium]
MKKVITKPIITVAFLAAVMGVSSVPLSAGAQDGRNWNNNNSWSHNNRWDNDNDRWGNNNDGRRRISDWEARDIAQRHFPNRWVVSDDQWRDRDGRLERRYHFNDNHVIVIRDDGVVIVIVQR